MRRMRYYSKGRYKILIGTFLIVAICIGMFLIDCILRISEGTSFSDIFWGRNPYDSGLYPYIWFKMSLIGEGEVWRVVSWLFWSSGVVSFIVDLCLLVLLCSSIEKRIGTLRFLFFDLLLALTLLASGFVALWANNGFGRIDFGMGASINFFVLVLAGVYLTLQLTKESNEEYDNNQFTTVVTLVYVITNYSYLICRGWDRFIYLCAFAVGTVGGMLITWNNQKIFIPNKIKNYTIAREVDRKKSHPGIVSMVAICIVIYLLSCIDSMNVNGYLVVNSDKVREGQWWRLFTNGFTHSGLIHMLTNMPVLYFAGKYVEERIGALRLYLVFMGSTFAVTFSWLLAGANMTQTGGSSLGLYAFIAMFFLYTFKEDSKIRCHKYEFIYIAAYFVIGNVPGIGVWGEGHLSSYLFGFIVVIASYLTHYNIKMRND